MALNFPYVFGSGGGGGSHIVPPHMDVYTTSFSPVISAQNGVYLASGALVDNAGDFSFVESQAGFEGINFELSGLTAGTSYIVNFDFQFLENRCWFIGTEYRTGVNVFPTNKSDYDIYSGWTENLDRDYSVHNHQIAFTAASDKMYLSFNLCGLSDAYTNYFNIMSLYVEPAP